MDRETTKKHDCLIDLTGLRTGVPVSSRLILSLVGTVLLFALCTLLPLDGYGKSTAAALGFFAASIFLIIFSPVNIAVDSILIAVTGIALGFWEWEQVGQSFGSSSFLTIMGMIIVSMGSEFTPFGRRVAYTMLRRFGNHPAKVVVAIAVASACLSSFVSNVAVIIMMSGICAEILNAMGEKPGDSRIGKAIMMIIPTAAIIGGVVLINGSPTGNTMAIQFLSASTDGRFTVTYSQWALCGVPCFLVTIVPICLIYLRCFKISPKNVTMPDMSYYDRPLNELGKLGGSEIRWIVTVLAMVACMLAGMPTGMVSLLFAAVTMFPGVGTVPADKAIKKLPVQAMIAAGLMPLLSQLFSSTGLGELVSDVISPLVVNAGPLGLSIISALIMGVLVNMFVNAGLGVSALVIGMISPVCMELGYNPVPVMMPTLFIASFFFVIGSNNIMLLNMGYGYWTMKDPILPGILSVLLCAVLFPVVCCLICPAFGIPLYI